MNVFNRFRGSGGGSMGKMFNTIKIPASGKYDLAGGKWLEETVPSSQYSGIYQTAIIGNVMYFISGVSSGGFALITRDLESNVITQNQITMPTSTSYVFDLFAYNNELYAYGYQTPNVGFVICRLDTNTFKFTYVVRALAGTDTVQYFKAWQVTPTRFLFIANGGSVYTYDFSGSILVVLFDSGGGNSGSALQRLSDGNYLIGVTGNGTNTIKISKYFTATNTITVNIASLAAPATVSFLQAFQLGEKLFFCIGISINGHNTGELDLLNRTMDFSKYPDHPIDGIFNNRANGFSYRDNVMFYTPTKKYYLPLIQSPPEQNAVVAKIYKGQSYNTPFETVDFSAIPNQSAATISPQTHKAAQDLTFHLGQYEHIGELPINVWGE